MSEEITGSEITPKNYNNILTKGLQSSLESTQVEDGKLRYTTDTGNLYLDNGSVRVKISDIIMGMTEEEIADIIAPLPKLYLAADTCRLYTHDPVKGWIDVSGVRLNRTEAPDTNQSIWFSENDEEQPSYDETFTYNSSEKKLSVTNINTEEVAAKAVNTETVNTESVTITTNNIDGMQITTSVDESGNKISEFKFITDEESTPSVTE